MTKLKSSLNSIEQLITTLGEKLELTDLQIADVLWLMLKRQEFLESPSDEQKLSIPLDGEEEETARSTSVNETESGKTNVKKDIEESSPQKRLPIKKESVYTSRSFSSVQGLPIRVPNAPSLREPIYLAQSLYPLMRRVPTGSRTILDEVATVERIAKEKVYLPVMCSEPEPWLDLALVIDESQSMLIWRHTIHEIQRLLKHYGIFRELRVWGIKPNEKGEELQIFSRWGSNQRIVDQKEIIDPTGRRLILIVSDCVSNLWRKGMIFPILHEWTQKQPLAVIQMLPEWMWRRSSLGLGTAVGFSSSIAGAANRDLLVNKKFFSENRTKIPVLTLEREKAARWSQMLVGKADAAVPGYILPPQLIIQEHPLLQRQQQALSQLNASQRIDRFRKTTSPLGRKLAGLLAAAPVISLPIVRLIQESLLPESRQVQVAEVFLGGLLKPNPESPIEADTNPDTVEYEFIKPEMRDIFLEDAPLRDSTDVLNAVSRYVAEQMGKSLDEFMALLKTPRTAAREQVKPFAEVTARILRKLGGDYVAIADQLEAPIALKSERGIDYTKLRNLLAAGKWFEADQETVKVMCQAGGRENEGWLRVEDIDNFPCDDLRTINQLWLGYSNGKFSFCVQKEIYESLGGTREYDQELWEEFGDLVGWRKERRNWRNYSEMSFNLNAKQGHLPCRWHLDPSTREVSAINRNLEEEVRELEKKEINIEEEARELEKVEIEIREINEKLEYSEGKSRQLDYQLSESDIPDWYKKQLIEEQIKLTDYKNLQSKEKKRLERRLKQIHKKRIKKIESKVQLQTSRQTIKQMQQNQEKQKSREATQQNALSSLFSRATTCSL